MGDPAGVFEAVVRARRMTRSFRPDPLDRALVDRLVDLARRAPSAGNTAGLRFLVLDTPDDVAAYWDTTLPEKRRATFPWPGLLRAPVLVVPCVSAGAYLTRYAERDKAARVAASAAARRALGADAAAWAVPYWFVDGGMAAMALLLGAEAAGLGALFFGLFEHEPAVRARFGVPSGWRPIGVIALGWPDDAAPAGLSASARRGRPSLAEVLHRGRWPVA
jgi:nitroreductase